MIGGHAMHVESLDPRLLFNSVIVSWSGAGINHAAGAAIGPQKGAWVLLPNIDDDSDWLLFRYALVGDASRDGKVNDEDVRIVVGRFNQSGTFAQGDFNADNKVTIEDFSQLAANVNQLAAE